MLGLRVFYGVDIARECEVAVVHVELGDFKLAARYNQSPEAGGHVDLRIGHAVHLRHARERRFFAVGHGERVRREFALRLRYGGNSAFHTAIVCAAPVE